MGHTFQKWSLKFRIVNKFNNLVSNSRNAWLSKIMKNPMKLILKPKFTLFHSTDQDNCWQSEVQKLKIMIVSFKYGRSMSKIKSHCFQVWKDTRGMSKLYASVKLMIPYYLVGSIVQLYIGNNKINMIGQIVKF